MEDVVMKIEDLSRARPAALPDGIVIPGAVEICSDSSETLPAGSADPEEYMPMPTPPPVWPRVFPGL
jgi:hypothetical protein